MPSDEKMSQLIRRSIEAAKRDLSPLGLSDDPWTQPNARPVVDAMSLVAEAARVDTRTHKEAE